MAFGDGRDDEALRAAWKLFCQRLQDAGDRAFKDYNPPAPLHRADAFRFLTQNLGQAFDLAYETKDTQFPVIHAFCTPFCKLGGDNADFIYQQAWIDGQTVYKISGNRGTARFLNFTVQGPRPEKQPGTDWPSLHEPFGDRPEANLFGHQLETGWDGSFELYIGGPQRAPNWLPTTPGSRKLFLRQGFDRWSEQPGRMRIERVGMSEPRPLPTPKVMINAMDWAGRFLTGVMNDWPDHPYNYTKAPYLDWLNQFPPEPEDSAESDQRRGRAIANMNWALAPDEALIIEFDDNKGLWSVTNMGPFFTSMDFLYRPVSYTPSRTRVDSDGKVRLILCHDDPGYHNWLDTQGFERGGAIYRLLMSEERTVLRTRVVKRSQLAGALPPDTVKVTHEERIRQMRERFDGIRQRYGL
ncbi:MAG TPA: hypothetical protein VFE56_13530 [Candidatus Binataceae bacterium]|nr:hypothetical protein [Candidatus Binataceae bacterium]